MKFEKLTLTNTDCRNFIEFWSSLYDYSHEALYKLTEKEQFTLADVQSLYEWKNGSRLSQAKQEALNKITDKLTTINELKIHFNLDEFNTEFEHVSAIWKIFLLHIIAPTQYPIFDQHVARSYYYIVENRCREIPLKKQDREKLYREKYLVFFEGIVQQDLPHKKVDEALWAFGKFLKTNYGKACTH